VGSPVFRALCETSNICSNVLAERKHKKRSCPEPQYEQREIPKFARNGELPRLFRGELERDISPCLYWASDADRTYCRGPSVKHFILVYGYEIVHRQHGEGCDNRADAGGESTQNPLKRELQLS